MNTKFFQNYDAMMEALREKGIVAHIMLKVYNKRVKWPAKWSQDEERFFRYVVARYQGFANVVWDYSKESYNEKDDVLQARLSSRSVTPMSTSISRQRMTMRLTSGTRCSPES